MFVVFVFVVISKHFVLSCLGTIVDYSNLLLWPVVPLCIEYLDSVAISVIAQLC